MKILTISKKEFPGGAELSAYNLFKAYRSAGHRSWMAVKEKNTDDPDIFLMQASNWHQRWGQHFQERRDRLECKNTPIGKILGYISILPNIRHYWCRRQGYEDFYYAGARRLLRLLPSRPDIIHCHNLHANYFNLQALPAISRRGILILNMRDSWMLTGHCAYPGDCERWRTGCGRCPDLERYPPVEKDSTDRNWRVKMNIYRRTAYHLTAPSQWQLAQAEASPLGQHAVSVRMIPNGIDTDIFAPMAKQDARNRLGFPLKARIVLMAGQHQYKDTDGMFSALERLPPSRNSVPHLFVCLGRDGETRRLGHGELHFAGYVADPYLMRQYYCAADVYLHAAEAEAFGKMITESMACGTPVVATATGGIPEQIVDGKVGFLCKHRDRDDMFQNVNRLLNNESMCGEMGSYAVMHVRHHFTIKRQSERFLEWFSELLDARQL